MLEHIGLGRYGDPIDPQGTEKAATELQRVLAPGGDLYLSLPIEKESRVFLRPLSRHFVGHRREILSSLPLQIHLFQACRLYRLTVLGQSY